MKTTHLARTKAEKTAEAERYSKPMDAEEDYPYGTRVSLDHDTLAKMGITDAGQLPKSGTEMQVGGTAKVIGSRSEDRNGEARHSLDLQLTHFGMEAPPDEVKAKAAAGMYPSAKAEPSA